MRFEGTIKTWNDAKGFGFLSSTQGGQDIFVHASALPRGTGTPRVGQAFTFEVELNHDGKKRAVNVAHAGRPAHVRNSPGSGRGHRASPAGWIMGLLLVVAVGAFGYTKVTGFLARANEPAQTDVQPASVSDGVATMPTSFRCDGRTYCSQMTSCAEATYFLKNCPGTKMDGNGDGVPCEQQWCTSPFAK